MLEAVAGTRPTRRNRHHARRHHPILRPPAPATSVPVERRRTTRRTPAVAGAAGCSSLAPLLIARGGLATTDDLVLELFNVSRTHPDFEKRRRIVYRWRAGRVPFGQGLWDRAALGYALLGAPQAPTEVATAAATVTEVC